jgi:glucose-1-phosphate cytidylyltransferase
MKVVLFCGGLGTRIREYSESIPKPMVPVGHQPILCHVMQYYSQYGHDDFILCLGYKANVIKDYFLSNRQTANSDCVVSEFGKKVEILGDKPPDWRVSLVDTGTWRNIGERLMAVKHLVKDEEMFLANYSDGLTDAPLPEMIQRFKESGKIACFIAVRRGGVGEPYPLQPGVRHLDQRRLLHLPQGNLRLHQGRRGTRARAVQPPDRGRPPDGLQV